jgi:hypothetical protein
MFQVHEITLSFLRTFTGSFLDGGANHPMQLAAIPLLDPAYVAIEKVYFD